VAGLPHDRVRVGALPEGLGHEPGPQRVPAQPLDLGRGVAGFLSAATDDLPDRVPGDRSVADDAGAVHRPQQRPGRIGGFREPGGAADV
jgi:hypothetical protein